MKKVLILLGLVLFINSCGPRGPLVEFDPSYSVWKDARGLSIRNSLYNVVSIPYSIAKINNFSYDRIRNSRDLSYSLGFSNSSIEEARTYSYLECNRRYANKNIDPKYISNGNICYIIGENLSYDFYVSGYFTWFVRDIEQKNRNVFTASLKQQIKKQEQISELNSISGEEKK